MTRISPASETQLAESKDLLALAAAAMGYEANSLKVMARQPAMLQGFMGLSAAILGPHASLDPVLRQMIAHIASAAAGCAYCQAHTAHGAEHRGADADKLAALWSFETSDLFSPAEKAALDLALERFLLRQCARCHRVELQCLRVVLPRLRWPAWCLQIDRFPKRHQSLR